MAIDSRDKRGNCINIDGPYRPVWPNPNGAIDQADRQHIAFKYRGISALVGGTSAAVRAILHYRRRRV